MIIFGLASAVLSGISAVLGLLPAPVLNTITTWSSYLDTYIAYVAGFFGSGFWSGFMGFSLDFMATYFSIKLTLWVLVKLHILG